MDCVSSEQWTLYSHDWPSVFRRTPIQFSGNGKAITPSMAHRQEHRAEITLFIFPQKSWRRIFTCTYIDINIFFSRTVGKMYLRSVFSCPCSVTFSTKGASRSPSFAKSTCARRAGTEGGLAPPLLFGAEESFLTSLASTAELEYKLEAVPLWTSDLEEKWK